VLQPVNGLMRELIFHLVAHASPTALTNASYALLCRLLVDRVARAGQLAEPSFESEYVARAVEWLKQNPPKVSLPELARRIGTTPRTLSRAFQKELGMSPGRYLIAKRLDAAAQQLASTKRMIKDIAFEAGYQSVSQFNAAFRKANGCTPSEHRAKGDRLV
jgi:transcriptional regulator GlxA family with amidase domain